MDMAVSGMKLCAMLAIAALASLGAAPAARAQYNYDYEGGYVKPCSLEGVNPVHHPEIFGNPAIAREYGFVRARDGTWQVGSDCYGQSQPAAPSAGRPKRKR
jgi:hypothetical protein